MILLYSKGISRFHCYIWLPGGSGVFLSVCFDNNWIIFPLTSARVVSFGTAFVGISLIIEKKLLFWVFISWHLRILPQHACKVRITKKVHDVAGAKNPMHCTGKRGPEMRPEAEKPRSRETTGQAEKYETIREAEKPRSREVRNKPKSLKAEKPRSTRQAEKYETSREVRDKPRSREAEKPRSREAKKPNEWREWNEWKE